MDKLKDNRSLCLYRPVFDESLDFIFKEISASKFHTYAELPVSYHPTESFFTAVENLGSLFDRDQFLFQLSSPMNFLILYKVLRLGLFFLFRIFATVTWEILSPMISICLSTCFNVKSRTKMNFSNLLIN